MKLYQKIGFGLLIPVGIYATITLGGQHVRNDYTMNHLMKNPHEIGKVDTNGDGKITTMEINEFVKKVSL